ncbi:uncharacterized protein LOC143034506 isoform X2 [Oratosquilla oratoria]|uniref:uncharacterized protein LOC143034506 isoform X2 n=1 Tax=Oratosquilla oratoria TaxID=337810 RepID=UPI003F75C48F
MEELKHMNNSDNESSDNGIATMFSNFNKMNHESPDYTLAKMTTYASEFQRHAKEKLTEAENQLSLLEESCAAAKVSIDNQVQRALAFVTTWKQDFMKELEEEYCKSRNEVLAFKQNLSNNNEMLLKAIFKAQVCLASKHEDVTEDQCYIYLTGLMEPAEHIIQTRKHSVDRLAFVPNEKFEEECCQKEVKHLLGYVQSLPYRPNDFQLEEVNHGTFKVVGGLKPMAENTKGLLVWQIESWSSGVKGEVMTVTGVDIIALHEMNVAPGLYLIAAKVFHQHVNSSPRVINFASVKDEEVQKTCQDLSEGFSPNGYSSEIEVLDTSPACMYPLFGSKDGRRSLQSSVQEIIVEDEILISEDGSTTSTVEMLDKRSEKSEKESLSDLEKDLKDVNESSRLFKNVGKPLGKLVSRKTQLSEVTCLRKPRLVGSRDTGTKVQKIKGSYKLQDEDDSSYGKDLKLPGITYNSMKESKPDIDVAERNNMTVFINQRVRARLLFKTAGILKKPIGIAELSNRNIIVADTFNDRMVIFSSRGKFLKQFAAPGGLRKPSAIVLLPKIGIAIKDNHSIVVCTEEGEFIHRYAENNLSCPYGLTKDSNGNLVTLEVRSDCITIATLDMEKGTIKKIPVHLPHAQGANYYSKPRFLTWQYPNTLLVVDLGMDCVYMVNPDTGEVINSFGQFGKKDGYFHDPSGIACDKDGYIFVGDSRNHRIQVFDKMGVFLGVLKMNVVLNRPSGIHLTPDGSLLVLNYWDDTAAKYSLETC